MNKQSKWQCKDNMAWLVFPTRRRVFLTLGTPNICDWVFHSSISLCPLCSVKTPPEDVFPVCLAHEVRTCQDFPHAFKPTHGCWSLPLCIWCSTLLMRWRFWQDLSCQGRMLLRCWDLCHQTPKNSAFKALSQFYVWKVIILKTWRNKGNFFPF